MDDGLYSLDYGAAGDGETIVDGALALLREGRILGSDRWGGVFEGSYSFDRSRGNGRLKLRLRVPPGGVLVTGFTADDGGATIEVAGEIAGHGSGATVEVAVGGTPVRIRLTYLGPVPV